MKKFQPVNNNVIIKLGAGKEEKTASGLFIPDTAKEKPLQGEVVAISTEVETSVAVGDTVIYKKYAGTEVSLENEDFIILPVDEILAKVVTVDKIPV